MFQDDTLIPLETAIQTILDRAKKQGRCTGYEIADAEYDHGTYVVKIGIYPWGMTFLEGRLTDILREIRHILQDIQTARIRCPICGTAQPLAPTSIDWPPWQCQCGTRFFPEGDTLRDTLDQVLTPSVDPESLAEFHQRWDQGWDPIHLIIGLDQVENHHVLVYRLISHATLRPYARLPWSLILDDAFTCLGFDLVDDDDPNGYLVYEGRMQNQTIRLACSTVDNTLMIVWPDLSMHTFLGSDGDASDWSDFLRSDDNPESPPWTITDTMFGYDNPYWIAAQTDSTYIAHDSRESTLASLFTLLPMAYLMACETIQRFLRLHPVHPAANPPSDA